MEQIDNLKELINQGDVDTAIKQLDQLLQDLSLIHILTSHFANQGIWAFYGTDRSGVFAIESTYGNLENYDVPVAVARPFFAF